jgi:hypothetical protein
MQAKKCLAAARRASYLSAADANSCDPTKPHKNRDAAKRRAASPCQTKKRVSRTIETRFAELDDY